MAKRILVVDDDPQVIELERVQFESAGHHVQTSSSIWEAIQQLRDSSFDVLVTDLVIEYSTDGFILATLFKHANPGGTAIMNTGAGDIGSNLNEFQQQIDQVLVKPTDLKAMAGAVERAPEAGPRPGRQRLSDLLGWRHEEIAESWLNRVETDPLILRIPLDRKPRLDEIVKVIDSIIARIARPAGPQSDVSQAEKEHAQTRRDQGYSPVATLLEMIHLQDAINEEIERNLLFVNLGSLWRDILALNRAIGVEAMNLMREIDG